MYQCCTTSTCAGLCDVLSRPWLVRQVLLQLSALTTSRHCWTRASLIFHYLRKSRYLHQLHLTMLKTTKRLKPKKRLKVLSSSEKSNPMKNINIAGILSEVHPVAAGVYNTAYFVIINQKHKVKTEVITGIDHEAVS